ncbi:unnamed protein product [Orchesella dallaii]|uniref:Uncharacterized protein n=1 Tax=Orchesella dallaii TaxID=48710 RepID=A0ABP1RJB7_9HEXA
MRFQFPVNLNVNCFINSIKALNTEYPQSIFNEKKVDYIRSHTLHTVDRLNFGFQKYNPIYDKRNVTLNQGYLRFGLKYRSPCIIFLIVTETLEEILNAIENSGFGTSEDALFLILRENINDEDYVVNVTSDLLNYEALMEPFHADIIFFQPDGTSKSFCQFCPTKLEPIKSVGSKLSIDTAKLQSKQRKGDGHGNTLFLYFPFMSYVGIGKYGKRCVERFKYTEYHDRFGLPPECDNVNYSILAMIQPILNITIKGFGRGIVTYHRDWFLMLSFGEASERIPNQQLKYRTRIFILDHLELDTLVCVKKKDLLSFDIQFLSTLCLDIFVCLGFIFGCYAFIYKSFSKSLDLLWGVLGRSFQYNHPRNFVFLHLVAGILLLNIYSSHLSSESMKLLEFPEYKHLIKKGYRILTQYIKYIYTWKTLPVSTKRKMEAIYGTIDDNLLYLPTDELRDWDFYDDWVRLLSKITEQKLILPGSVNTKTTGLFRVFGHDAMHVGDDTVCKVFDSMTANVFVSSNFVRIWSYMSFKFADVLHKFREHGIYQRIDRSLGAREIKKSIRLGLMHTRAFTEPEKLGVVSVVGVVCLGHCVFGLACLCCFMGLYALIDRPCKFLNTMSLKFSKSWKRFKKQMEMYLIRLLDQLKMTVGKAVRFLNNT